MPASLPRLGAQLVCYAAFAAAIAWLSQSPPYTHAAADAAAITLSFSHAGAHVVECQRRTQAELDALAPNMRRPLQCPRARVPLLVELEVDGALRYRDELAPAGLAGDGASTAYRRVWLTPGTHRIVLRLRDSRRQEGFDWEMERTLAVRAGQHVVIDFRAGAGGFRIL